MFIPEIPDNSLKDILKEIVYIAQNAVSTGEYSLQCSFNPPASELDIVECEKIVNAKFTDDFKNFLKFSNGAELCFNSISFYSINEIISDYRQEKVEEFPSDYIVIADIIGDGEILCFDRKTNKYIRYFDGDEREFNSFLDFLIKFIPHIKDKVEEYVDI